MTLRVAQTKFMPIDLNKKTTKQSEQSRECVSGLKSKISFFAHKMCHNAHQSDSNKFFSLQVNGTVIFPLKFSAIPLNPRSVLD